MSEEKLYNKLLTDLKLLGFDTTGFELKLRPYSKSYYGRYHIQKKIIIVYIYSDKNMVHMIPYSQLFKTLIHEAIHHVQWSNSEYVRVKGVMHNEEFYKLYNQYEVKYNKLKIKQRLYSVSQNKGGVYSEL